ncbi:MAG: ATP-binding cassette domain-containing protein [Betaproteobacteria bacterium]|nr:ATP-binding cassette domain-containing protein [Betaproteobacteria bacterium]
MSFALEGVGLVHPGGNRALSALTLGAEKGERVAIIGPSGAGKTSLLRLLATSIRPSEGRLQVLGENPWQLERHRLRRMRSRIGMVHQAPPIPPRQRAITAVLAGRLGAWPWWKAMASLLYPVDIAGARSELARLDLADRLFERCDRLSGGQLQRVGVARVLYQKAELILADEPVSAMDPTLADHALAELAREALSRGITLAASLHAVDLALRHFPRIVGIKSGEIAFDLPPARVTDALLVDLYAGETAVPPTQDNRSLELAPSMTHSRRAAICSVPRA